MQEYEKSCLRNEYLMILEPTVRVQTAGWQMPMQKNTAAPTLFWQFRQKAYICKDLF